jgi:ABC-type lipoprotein export system ATPase subunit
MILTDLRLGLKPGEIVALVGPSGSGKSELLQVLAGLRAADKGQVTVLGRNLPTVETSGGNRPNLENDRELARWRIHSVGYLASEAELNPRLTALEQVMWMLEQAGFGRDPLERMEKATAQLGLVGLADPEIMKLRPNELNRTERKLVALARALALDPPLLLADEPTGRVPSAAADRIFNLLKQVAATGRTVFMVTSDPLWARNTDRQIEILDGAIVGSLS